MFGFGGGMGMGTGGMGTGGMGTGWQNHWVVILVVVGIIGMLIYFGISNANADEVVTPPPEATKPATPKPATPKPSTPSTTKKPTSKPKATTKKPTSKPKAKAKKKDDKKKDDKKKKSKKKKDDKKKKDGFEVGSAEGWAQPADTFANWGPPGAAPMPSPTRLPASDAWL